MYKDTKIVLTLHNESFKGKINKKLINKLKFDKIPAKDLSRYDETTYVDLMKAAIDLVDGVIIADEQVDPELVAYAKKTRTPIMPFKSEETFFADANNFYTKILSK
jgi:starch synthase